MIHLSLIVILSVDKEFILRVLERENVRRYLIGWNWSVETVKKALLETLRWHREFQPHRISCRELEAHFKEGKNYINGFDKEGNSIIYLRAGRDSLNVNKIFYSFFQLSC